MEVVILQISYLILSYFLDRGGNVYLFFGD